MIVDFRCRPPYEGYLGTQMYSRETIAWINRLMGTDLPTGPRAALDGSMPDMIREMDAAGVTLGVTQGRHRPGTEIPNATLHRLTQEYPGRFVALASVDVTNPDAGRRMIDEACGGFGFPGISLDLSVLGMKVDDRRVYPIYEHCQAKGVFVAITLSMLGAQTFELIAPSDLDRAARDFPQLQFVSAHGSYPFVMEVIGVGMKRENVWLSPDMYMTHAAGGDLYVQAANLNLGERMLFGTAYPYTPMDDTVRRFMRLPLKDDVKENILHRNARRLLKL